MPRYHFHVRDGIDTPDPVGVDLADLSTARAEALKLAGEMIRDAGLCGKLGEDWRVSVTDDAGRTLFVMTFSIAETPAATDG